MKHLLLLLLLFPLTTFAQSGAYHIKGHISGNKPTGKVYLTYRNGETVVIDSASLNNDLFEFRGQLKRPTGAYVIVDHSGAGLTKLNPRHDDRLPFFIEHGIINIAATDSIAKAKITGSKLNAENEAFKLAIKPYNDRLIAIGQQYMSASAEQKASAAFRQASHKQSHLAEDERKIAAIKFIEQHRDSYICFEALRLFGLKPNPAEVEPVFSKISLAIRESEPGKAYSEKLKKIRATAVGAIAPDFVQNDTSGHPVSLSGFRGKYVLVYFWASWLPSSRIENKNVVQCFNKYKGHNFTILGVSLDKERNNWIKYIQYDKMNWTQVSDLQFVKNAVAVQYNVDDIPASFLVDPRGKIIAKNLTGIQLEDTLNSIFK